jgi:hypothetical protein
MERSKSNRWLMLAIPMVSGFFLCSQPAHAQYANPNQVYGSVNQQMSQGLLSPGQAQDMMNRENNYAARAARLLHNDGGVLTPNDANKLAQEAAKDAVKDQSYVGNNLSGTGTGLSGLFGNLFGVGGSAPLTAPVGYGSYPFSNSSYTPYNGGIYNTSSYTTTPYNRFYAGNNNWQGNNWGREQSWREHERHEWREHQMGGNGLHRGWDRDGDGD